MDEPTILQTPEQRLQDAVREFEAINRMLPPGIEGFTLPPFAETTAAVDAVARILVDRDIITTEEFVAAKTTRMAELVEDMVRQARELRARVTGLIAPGPGRPV